MQSKFLFPYWCRYLGWGLVLLHVPLSMLGRSHGMINIMDAQSRDQGIFTGEHLFFISTTLIMSAGLFLVAFAKEKIEDEQIWQIRLDSLRWAIFINYLVLIISLVFIEDVPHMMELNLWVPLIFFIIRFRWVIWRLNQSSKREA